MDKKPKTLLINFFSADIKKLKFKNKIEAEFGYINPDGKFHFFPSPPYEYDIVIANLCKEIADVVYINFSEKQTNYQDRIDLGDNIWNGFLLAFLGNFENNGIENCGLNWLETVEADKRDKIFNKGRNGDTIFDFLFKNHNILLPVKKYINLKTDYHRKTLLVNKNNIPVAIYTIKELGTYIEDGGEEYTNYVPNCLILPQFKDNLEVINDVFKVIIPIRPDLFPLESSKKWLEDEPFIPPEVKEIEREIQKKRKEFEHLITRKKEQIEVIKDKYRYFTKILETDDQNYKGDDKLSVNVKKVLEFLKFEVIDIDEKLKQTIKKEDYWVIDKDYFALCEVTGTKSKNPKASEYNGILGRINTVLQRKENRVPEKYQKKIIKGLLIINHDRNTHPFKRPGIYTGSLEELAETAKSIGISILSTVELFKISKDVRENRLKKSEARSIVKQTGRIIYKNND